MAIKMAIYGVKSSWACDRDCVAVHTSLNLKLQCWCIIRSLILDPRARNCTSLGCEVRFTYCTALSHSLARLSYTCIHEPFINRNRCVSQGSLANTLREIRPTAFMGVPRVWEKMQEKMKAIGAKSSTVRRKVASWAKDVGLQTNLSKMEL